MRRFAAIWCAVLAILAVAGGIGAGIQYEDPGMAVMAFPAIAFGYASWRLWQPPRPPLAAPLGPPPNPDRPWRR